MNLRVLGRYSRAEIEAAHCFSSNDSLTQKMLL